MAGDAAVEEPDVKAQKPLKEHRLVIAASAATIFFAEEVAPAMCLW
jgi:hypothetical protein